jgi:antirestriction protein ArdC
VRRIPLLRAFILFHASQIEDIPPYVPPTVEEAPWRAPEAASVIFANSRAVLRVGGEKAFYSPATDHIQMPPEGAFATAQGYCGTLLHELGHWTGHASRLNRDLRNAFGSHDYAREELRAEIGQVMVCAELGIADCDFSNNAAYVASWLERLRSDRKEIFRAAADAQRIADYLLAFHPDYGGLSPNRRKFRQPESGTAAPSARGTFRISGQIRKDRTPPRTSRRVPDNQIAPRQPSKTGKYPLAGRRQGEIWPGGIFGG